MNVKPCIYLNSSRKTTSPLSRRHRANMKRKINDARMSLVGKFNTLFEFGDYAAVLPFDRLRVYVMGLRAYVIKLTVSVMKLRIYVKGLREYVMKLMCGLHTW